MDNDNNGNYEVGYGKTPKEHRFKPGQSGNKNGRPKSSKNVKYLGNLCESILDVLDKKTKIKMNNKVKKIKTQEALAASIIAGAIQGSTSRLNAFIKINESKQMEKALQKRAINNKPDEEMPENLRLFIGELRLLMAQSYAQKNNLDN